MVSASAVAFSAEAFLRELHTERFGRTLRAVAETSSTIDLAEEWLREGAPDGAVVIAGVQTRGRGRMGRNWASPRGGLWMSVIARPEMDVAHAGRLGIGLALAAAGGLPAECAVGLKWPNDVVIGGKKVGGVLVGTETNGNRIAAAVLSLGLNVNVPLRDLPEDARGTATSVREETGREHVIETIAARTLACLEAIWPAIVGEREDLVAKWRSYDVLAGQGVSVESGGKTVRGRANGIDAKGALVLLVDGEEWRAAVGEVTAVRVVER